MDEFFARNRLSAYLDGELPPGEAREVEAALQRSPALREELEALQRAVDFMHTHGPVPAPRGFAERLAERLADEPMPVGWWYRMRRVRMDVAMVAALAAGVILYVAVRVPNEDAATTAAPAPEPVASAAPPADAAPEAELVEDDGPEDDGPSLAAPRPAAKARPTPSSLPQKIATKKPSKGDVEREPYASEWEKDPEPVMPTVYSAGAVRYRLTPVGDAGLKQLAELAQSMGGRLTDGNGRPLAPYPMESGDVRVVRVQVPARNAALLESKLSSLGMVEVDPTVPASSTLYAEGAEVPVSIEVRAP